jgi:predicted RNase H-like HicB family nuclease
MNTQLTPEQALQLISEALEPAAQGKISRSGYIAIQTAIEVLAKAITPEPSESDATHD